LALHSPPSATTHFHHIMSIWGILRLSTFAIVLFCSLIALALAGHFTSVTNRIYPGLFFQWAALAIAVAVLTWISLLPMLLIDLNRRGSFMSWISVELGVVGVLMILWLSTAAYVSSFGTLNCDSVLLEDYDDAESICRQYQALQAFSWLCWLALLGYFTTILVLALIANGRGNHGIWKSAVSESDFSASSSTRDGTANLAMNGSQSTNTGTYYSGTPQPNTAYAPQQHYPQMQQPQTQTYQPSPSEYSNHPGAVQV